VRAKACLVGHGTALFHVKAEIVIGKPLPPAELDLPKHGVSAQTSPIVFGCGIKINAAQAIGASVADSHADQAAFEEVAELERVRGGIVKKLDE
jgi:hypothetical protein